MDVQLVFPEIETPQMGGLYFSKKQHLDVEQSWLCLQTRPHLQHKETKRVLDLFSGCGGMSLGIEEAMHVCGFNTHHIAVDIEEAPREIFRKNFPNSQIFSDVLEHINGEIGSPPSDSEQSFQKAVGKIDILVGGPPCQGHSDLNNHTRRMDPKNELYCTMARAAELFSPQYIIIENVPSVRHANTAVVPRTRTALQNLGYHIGEYVFHCDRIGVPQTRKRFILIGIKKEGFSEGEVLQSLQLDALESRFQTKIRPLSWAIADLESKGKIVDGKSKEPHNGEDLFFDTVSKPANITQERIDYLFTNEVYNLPDSERPRCHREKKHSYNSVYGRMFWEKPAQTISGNFGTPGGGRYIHSRQKRMITPHEVARVQFFPDFFDFTGVASRAKLQTMIGNAVPPKLAFVLTIGLMREWIPFHGTK